MANSVTVNDVLKMPLEERLSLYGSKEITSFTLDAETYSGYKGYSFFWGLTVVTDPERSQNGEMDLSSIAWFITPHLRIDFSLISYHDFMRLRQQQLSKLYFNLTCFDTDFNRTITEEVYFHPDTLPNFATMARKLNGEKWTEILGAKDYTVELVGTNRGVEQRTLDYNLNVPSDVVWLLPTNTKRSFAKNTTVGIGNNAIIPIGVDGQGNDITTKMSNVDFDGKYQFKYWNTKPDGTGFSYIDGDEYFLRKDTMLFAIWQGSAV